MNNEVKPHRVIPLTNKIFAEELMAHLNESKMNAKLTEKDGKFLLDYEINAAQPDGESVDSKLSHMANWMSNTMDRMCANMYAHIDRIYANHAKHGEGHLPSLTPMGLAKLIKASGEEGNYSIQPKTIYASTSTSVEFGAEELRNALNKLNVEEDKPKTDDDVNRLMVALRAQQK